MINLWNILFFFSITRLKTPCINSSIPASWTTVNFLYKHPFRNGLIWKKKSIGCKYASYGRYKQRIEYQNVIWINSKSWAIFIQKASWFEAYCMVISIRWHRNLNQNTASSASNETMIWRRWHFKRIEMQQQGASKWKTTPWKLHFIFYLVVSRSGFL